MLRVLSLCLCLGLANSGVRKNVVIVGTTPPPFSIQRVTGKVGGQCPESHPYPLNSYGSCCATANRSAAGGCAVGTALVGGDPLDCCPGGDHVDCPAKPCKAHKRSFEGIPSFTWTEWGEWSSCSATCATTTVMRQRTRTCTDLLGWGVTCQGEGEETEACPINNALISCGCLDFDMDYYVLLGGNNVGVPPFNLPPIGAHHNTGPGGGNDAVAACQAHCQSNGNGCTHFSYISSSGDCWLKNSEGDRSTVAGTISGPKNC